MLEPTCLRPGSARRVVNGSGVRVPSSESLDASVSYALGGGIEGSILHSDIQGHFEGPRAGERKGLHNRLGHVELLWLRGRVS